MTIRFLGTGSGTSTNSAHTVIVYYCDDGTRILVDASSGNSMARARFELEIPVESIDTVLRSHHHFDHMSGRAYVQQTRAQARPDAPPLDVYLTEECLKWTNQLCSCNPSIGEANQDRVTNVAGRQVVRWHVVELGQEISLGPTTAVCFPSDHIASAVV